MRKPQGPQQQQKWKQEGNRVNRHFYSAYKQKTNRITAKHNYSFYTLRLQVK